MTRAKDISKIVTDADLSGTLDVTGEVTTADDIKFTSGSRHKFVGGGTGNNLELGTYSSSNTSRDVHLQIDSAGNVGIGTSSPNSRLTSASADGSTGLSIHRTFSGNVSGETTIGGLDFTLTDTATSNQVVSRISPVGSAGTGDAFAGAMRFYTAGSNGSVAERMRIDSSGNVGIGISNPDDKLHVADSSNAELKLQTDNANGGSVVKFNRSGTDNSYIGTKGYFTGNSDNNLYLRANSGLGIQFYTNGNNERMRIDDNGHVTMPSQPAFLANLGASSQTNIAVGSDITVEFDTEIFDQNADYNTSTYKFTAPVTGRYQFNIVYYLENIDTASGYYYIFFDTSNRNYFNIMSPAFTSDPDYLSLTLSQLADMDAGDVAYCRIRQSHGTSQTDINANSYFSGYLVA